MRAPVTGAVLCAIAAVALLVAGFTPWFSTGKEIDYRMAYERRRADLDLFEDRVRQDEGEAPDVRANYGLVTGEVCIDLTCTAAKYTGSPGLADDAFAWLGRGTLGAAMASVALLVAVALAARTQRRTHLRGWAASMAGLAAGLGAMFAASWTFKEHVGYVSRGMGMTSAMAGAAFAGLGVGWPAARGNAGAAKRFAIALVIAVLAALAWITLLQHAWWRSGKALGEIQVSPLGVEVCEAGTCKLATPLGISGSLRALAALTAMASAVLLVPAFATAGRVARGVRPGAWGWAAAVVGLCALGAGVATFLVYPTSDVMHVAWGLPVFLVATAGATAATIAGVVLVKDADTEVVAAPAYRPEPAFTTNGLAIAPGERPQLAPLAAAPPAPAPAHGSAPASKYAPSAAVAAAAFEAATGRIYAPETETETETETVTESAPPSPAPAPPLEPPSPYAPRPAALAPPAANVPVPVRQQPTAPTTPIRKASPTCPTCRVATIYSSKRGAWWCSTCKRTL